MKERRETSRYVYTSTSMWLYGTVCEGEFLNEFFGDKEDLDRFKIPISGVSRGVDPFLPTNPLEYDATSTKSGSAMGISH